MMRDTNMEKISGEAIDETKSNLNRKLLVIIVSVLVFAGIGVAAYQYSRKTGQNTSLATGVNLPQFKKITSPYAIFFTDAVVPDKTHTIVQFPYYFDQNHQILWLSLQTEPNSQPINILVDHPIFKNLSWSKVSSDNYVLYQKEQTYKSIEEFLAQTPKNKQIIADPQLIFQKIIKPDKNVISLSDWDEKAEFDYILTTYHEPKRKGDYYEFETLVNASDGLISPCPSGNECQPRLMWKIDMPNVSEENPLYIGEIHVNFRQGT